MTVLYILLYILYGAFALWLMFSGKLERIAVAKEEAAVQLRRIANALEKEKKP